MITIQKAQNELNTLKEAVIGLFKVRGKFHLVFNYQEANQTVDSCFITEFGIIQKDFNSPVSFGEFKLFPDGKNMNQMLIDVYLWSDFINSF